MNRERYRKDPDFRAGHIRAVVTRHNQRSAADPEYAELVRIRKTIWRRRQSIEGYLEKIGKLELDLMRLLKRREILAQKLKGERPLSRRRG